MCTIDAPWAKDAEGDSLKTYYEVKGNSVVQHIEFDDNTKFPVVADPTTIVDTRVVVKDTYEKWLSAYAFGQGEKGTLSSKKNAITVGYYTGKSKTVQVDAGVSGKTVSLNVGYVTTKTSGSVTLITLEKDGRWYKIRYYEKWKLKYKAKQNKYKKVKITQNGKTKKIEYKWVSIKEWVEKDRYIGNTVKAIAQ